MPGEDMPYAGYPSKELLVAWIDELEPGRRKVNRIMREISDTPDNIVKRDFHAAAPNQLWLTDITEFSIPAGKVYLSPIIDCFDGKVAAHASSIFPNAELANAMLDGYIDWYNKKRMKVSLGGMSPAQYRRSLGLAA